VLVSNLIKLLEEKYEAHGDVNVSIYKSFEKKNVQLDSSDVFYDEKVNDIYIGIYD